MEPSKATPLLTSKETVKKAHLDAEFSLVNRYRRAGKEEKLERESEEWSRGEATREMEKRRKERRERKKQKITRRERGKKERNEVESGEEKREEGQDKRKITLKKQKDKRREKRKGAERKKMLKGRTGGRGELVEQV